MERCALKNRGCGAPQPTVNRERRSFGETAGLSLWQADRTALEADVALAPCGTGVRRAGNCMAKMTNATTWSKVGPDDGTGSLIDLNYTCPHCGYPTGELIFVGPGKDLDHGWETDQVCGVCDKQVTVMVRVAAS